MDGMDWLGMVGEYSGVYALSPVGQVELAKCGRSGIGGIGLELNLPVTTNAALAAGGDNCAWSYDCRVPQLG
ncbi:MAG: hypothetical protein NVS9B9_31940 [Ktedonobacteraceae bacterium]